MSKTYVAWSLIQYSCIISHQLSSLERRVLDSQIVNVTNFVVVSSVGINGTDCSILHNILVVCIFNYFTYLFCPRIQGMIFSANCLQRGHPKKIQNMQSAAFAQIVLTFIRFEISLNECTMDTLWIKLSCKDDRSSVDLVLLWSIKW